MREIGERTKAVLADIIKGLRYVDIAKKHNTKPHIISNIAAKAGLPSKYLRPRSNWNRTSKLYSDFVKEINPISFLEEKTIEELGV